MEYTYKICLTCDASGYDRYTKIRCPVCDGKGIKITPVEEKEPENKEED